MITAPYILARTLKDAHDFATQELGLGRGQYRIVNSPSTLKAVRNCDLYLVPGYKNRHDRFAIIGALRWTRLNKIDVEQQRAEAFAIPDGWFPFGTHIEHSGPIEFSKETDEALMPLWERPVVVDGLVPEGEQLTLVDAEEATDFVTNGDDMISEGSPVAPEQAEEPAKKPGRRRTRCKTCGLLHYKEDPCPVESDTLEGM